MCFNFKSFLLLGSMDDLEDLFPKMEAVFIGKRAYTDDNIKQIFSNRVILMIVKHV